MRLIVCFCKWHLKNLHQKPLRQHVASDHRVGGFFDQSRHFIDCVKSGEQPIGSFPSATKTVELVDAIYACSMI